MKFATRVHLQSIKDLELGNDRNALKILNEMKKDLIQSKCYNGKNVYFLDREGANVIGLEKIPTWSTHIDHHLLRNDIYVHYGCPPNWRTEVQLELKPIVGEAKYLVTDAHFTKEGRNYFVEVDHTQNMLANKKKIEYYAEVNMLVRDRYDPILIFYTTTPTRKETLTNLCKEKDLTFHILTKEDLA